MRELVSQKLYLIIFGALKQFSFTTTREKFLSYVTQTAPQDQDSVAACLPWSGPFSLLLLLQTDTISDAVSSQNPVPVWKRL